VSETLPAADAAGDGERAAGRLGDNEILVQIDAAIQRGAARGIATNGVDAGRRS